MAVVGPQFSRTKVDAAADFFVRGVPSPATVGDTQKAVEALGIMANWRASHAWPLLSTRLSLQERAQRLYRDALISQRLKRMPAIIAKLLRFHQMKLTQMQDIGGCRAVLSNVRLVERLDRVYAQAALRRQKHQPECIERYDYIKNPKPDGYRGVHLVYKYHTRLEKYGKHDGLRIEIQLRSQPQHEWATAVETVDLFTKQALKSSIGKDDWKRFFLLAGAAFAMHERRPLPAEVTTDRQLLREELRDLTANLNVPMVLSASTMVMQEFLPKRVPNASTFLLTLNVEQRSLEVKQYSQREQKQATDEYLRVEEEILAGKTGLHAVLVSVQSMQGLREAYPSFYADTGHFIERLNDELEVTSL